VFCKNIYLQILATINSQLLAGKTYRDTDTVLFFPETLTCAKFKFMLTAKALQVNPRTAVSFRDNKG
jgi:hypothetical protein